jgi:hypothetical protein
MRSQTRRAGRVVCQTTRLSSADSLSAAVVIRARHPGASFTPVTYTRRALQYWGGNEVLVVDGKGFRKNSWAV